MATIRTALEGLTTPEILGADDFHIFLVKLVTIGPFSDYQVRALCANEAAWNDLEAQYGMGRSLRIWKDAYDNSSRQGWPPKQISIYMRRSICEYQIADEIPSVAAFLAEARHTGDELDTLWRYYLVSHIADPITWLVLECLRLDEAIRATDPELHDERIKEEMRELHRRDPDKFHQMYGPLRDRK